ncbi:hypothetical protein [Paenibacillus chitinolyticus]|uniref:hypothetical protein n=1 Tax=Paenibacillus chitinolyticus TaxID=79263 RepID=UPI00295EF36E|nr:hypothetical protein [Paenibacillus chitinolyticus]
MASFLFALLFTLPFVGKRTGIFAVRFDPTRSVTADFIKSGRSRPCPNRKNFKRLSFLSVFPVFRLKNKCRSNTAGVKMLSGQGFACPSSPVIS